MHRTPPPAYDLTKPEVLSDPHALFRRMRREDPVHWSDRLQAWVLTRYADVARAFRDPRLSADRTDVFVNFQLRGGDPAVAADYVRMGRQQMLMKDGADHHRLRTLGNHGFTPSLLERARPMIQRVMDGLLDAVAGRKQWDVVRDLARPLPAVVIAELFDVPARDRDFFQEASDALAKFFGGTLGDPEADARAANAATLQLEQYFTDLIEKRRETPGHDLMSLLIAGQEAGRISAEEVCCQCILLLTAGHVTTIDQLSNAVYTLLRHPDQLQKLRDDPALIKSAVEETLRYDAAVPFILRIAREDLDVVGKTIRKGQFVYLGLAAANRDPEAFTDPDRFDVARANNCHLAFGAGPHVCIGGGLARRELEIGLLTLFRRAPRLRLIEGGSRRRCESLVFRGFHSLPVESCGLGRGAT
jgi:cytochrome P450 PksS